MTGTVVIKNKQDEYVEISDKALHTKLTSNGSEIDGQNPLPIFKGFNIPTYDDIVLGYTGDDLTTATYKYLTVVVATLTLSYTSGKLVGVVHT